ncbi:MAG: PorV/PorQ family protein [Bacteroidetes bacterium]|nr:PorV/PorQ family protein [Bacteroidota bacterium]
MKIRYIHILCISLFITSTLGVYASPAIGVGSGSATTESYAKVGMSGGQFLKIAHGARGNGMAGAVSALTDDLSSIFWNPAGIADIPSLSAEFDYTQWFAGLNHNFGAVGLPFGDGYSLALHFTSLSTPEMERTTIERPEGLNSYFTASDVAVGLTFAGYLTDQFSFGVTGRYLNNTLGNASASGFAFDVGTKYRTGIQGIVLGVSLHGLTTELTYEGNEFNKTLKIYDAGWQAPSDLKMVPSPFNIPLLFRANVAFDIIGQHRMGRYDNVLKSEGSHNYNKQEHTLVGAIDFTTTSDSPEQFALGLEYVWNELIAVRAGYRIGNDIQGFSAGIGINYFSGFFNGRIDYSISPLAYNLGLANRISVYLDLGGN